jgi:hypothetical protein
MDDDAITTLHHAEYWIGFHMWRAHHRGDEAAEQHLTEIYEAISKTLRAFGIESVGHREPKAPATGRKVE